MLAGQADVLKFAERFAKFPDPKKVQKTMFDILITYCLYNWDGAAYNPSLFELLFPFLDAYLEQCGDVGEDGEREIFTVFASFFEGNFFGDLKKPQKQPFIRPLFAQIGKTIETKFPDLLQVLSQKHVFTLDFLRNDLSRWFMDVFETSDIRILWISILTFEKVQDFFESFIIARLMMVLKQIDDLNPLCFDEFINKFHQVKKDIPLRPVLAVTGEVRKMVSAE